MMRRCHDPRSEMYSYYGARGIEVWKPWHFFKMFQAWCELTYIDGLTLDRINPDGNYTPENCRWADKSTQQFNRRPYGYKNRKAGRC